MSTKANTLGLPTDSEGFLCHLEDWSLSVAESIAAQENLILTPDHWQVIHLLRNYYLQYQLYPSVRVLIKKLMEEWGTEKANSLYLHQLFPKGPIKQASKIAGLPKPLKCL